MPESQEARNPTWSRDELILTLDLYVQFKGNACATVAVAYHRAAGVYVADEKMKELGSAAVHLLTMATLYIRAQKE